MLLTLQGFWTVSLYFGLLGIIWLPRYYIIPTKLRLWPSYWLYTTFTSSTPVTRSSSLQERYISSPHNYTFNIEYKTECFSCDVILRPTHCTLYSDVIFKSLATSLSYDVFTHENYPCYKTVARQRGQCDDHKTYSGAGCTLCSLCRKNTMYNTSRRAQYRKYTYSPRFSISLGGTLKPGSRQIVHCLNKMVLLRFYDKSQFCGDLQNQISVYKEGRTTVFTGCTSLCSDSANVMYRELYSTELGLYIVLLVSTMLCLVLLATCVSYCYSLYKELGIINVPWNSPLLCPICMETLHRFTRINTLHCGHVFCKGCLYRWLRVFGHVTCPMCRQAVDPNAPRLSTSDNSPQLMISNSTYSTSDSEDTESLTESASQSSIVQSIYNIGRNVVSGWALHHSASHVEEISTDISLVPLPGNRETLIAEIIDREPLVSDPIPLPYYPLFSNTSSPIVVPYTSSSLTTIPSSSFTYPFHSHLCHTFSHSDTELMGPSSRLQNRIAKKINRIKNRRVRRTQSTSDVTSVTSNTESETDHE